MHLNIDPKVFEQHPDLKIGAILIKGFNNTKRVSAVEGLLRGICAQREKEFKDQDIYENEMVGVWSNAYGKFGINPRKFPPSIAALLKRVKSGREIPHINLLVDLYNYFSLKYLLPIGGEDLDWLYGDLKLSFTRGEEPFRPIGSIDVEHAKEGELCYMDQGGITCRYWNYRECERTKFTERTCNAVLLIEDLSKMHMDEFGAVLTDIQANLIKYVGGRIEPYILNEDSPSIDLGIQGRAHADDSKVPQQEIAHYKKLHEQVEAVAENPKESEKNEKPELPKKKDLSRIPSSKPLEVEAKTLFKQKIKDVFVKILAEIAKSSDIEIHIEYPASPDHGDYSTNVAMRLAKPLSRSPLQIAQQIIEKMPKVSFIDRVETAGPGFINIFLSEKAIKAETGRVLKEEGDYGSSKIGNKRTIIIEYSQPNIAKPLGVHHLLSTIIGQSIYNIFKYLGFKTISINHIGDWGTQFGKLICAYKKWGDKKVVEKNPISELLKLYVKFHDEAEKRPELEDEGREEFRKFEEGDKENHELWKWFVDESMKEIQKTYDKLGGIHFDYTQGESFYQDKMQAVLESGKKKGVFVVGEEGAYVVHFDDPHIPTVPVQKKDGATLYITRDFATAKYRTETWRPERILYVVDSAQTMHFKQIFETCRMFGWDKFHGEHVSFGRMHLKDGRASTRKGNIVLLDEVLDEGVKRAMKIVEEKSPELQDKEKIARTIGIGAIKYNILSQNRSTDITFDWDNMLSLDGNSAPYLQYTYARAKSIVRKALDTPMNHHKDPSDSREKIRSLMSFFPKFPEQIAMSASEYKPNILGNYLYELAQRFNSFYNTVPVLGAQKESDRKLRLEIVQATAQILKNGLNLLGVEVVEEM